MLQKSVNRVRLTVITATAHAAWALRLWLIHRVWSTKILTVDWIQRPESPRHYPGAHNSATR
jgi:hypothetical protein